MCFGKRLMLSNLCLLYPLVPEVALRGQINCPNGSLWDKLYLLNKYLSKAYIQKPILPFIDKGLSIFKHIIATKSYTNFTTPFLTVTKDTNNSIERDRFHSLGVVCN
jgi:hypothetical protein